MSAWRGRQITNALWTCILQYRPDRRIGRAGWFRRLLRRIGAACTSGARLMAWSGVSSNMVAFPSGADRERRATDQAIVSEKINALSRMLAGISHEINTPVGNIIMSSSSLKNEIDTVALLVESKGLSLSRLRQHLDDCKMVCELIERNGDRLGALVMNYKQLAMDEKNHVFCPFNLCRRIEAVVRTFAPTTRPSGVVIDVDVCRGIDMHSYPGAIDQILGHLVENSMVHGFAGAGNGRIRILGRLRSNAVELVYEDDGCGIEEHIQYKVFDPFYSTRMCNGNSGLGLSIVHNIVASILKGGIELESAPGEGVHFILTLPQVLN
jgi:signal transduction histidine kinase